jgi:hypothetical protein
MSTKDSDASLSLPQAIDSSTDNDGTDENIIVGLFEVSLLFYFHLLIQNI